MLAAPYKLRRLGGADLPAMRGLLALYAEAFEMPGEYLDRQPDDDWLGHLLQRPDFICLIAELENGQIVGGLSAYLLQKFEQPRQEIFIYDLAVAEAWRRRGIASQMLGWVSREAEQLGAWVIIIEAEEGDEPAIQLYRKLASSEEIAHHFNLAPQRG